MPKFQKFKRTECILLRHRFLSSFVILVGLTASSYVLAETKPFPEPYLEAREVSEKLVQSIIESYNAKSPLLLPSKEIAESVPEWKEWPDNFHNVVGDIDRISLRFVRKRAKPSPSVTITPQPTNDKQISEKDIVDSELSLSEEDQSAPSPVPTVEAESNPKDESEVDEFVIDVIFETPDLAVDRLAYLKRKNQGGASSELLDSFVLRHSLASQPDQRGGMRISSRNERRRAVYLSGSSDSGALVLIPPIPSNKGIGFLICPRDRDMKDLKRGAKRFFPTEFSLKESRAEVKGLAQVGVETGFGPGYARAFIRVTPNITPSKYWIDESITQHPYVSVEYKAERESPWSPFRGQGYYGLRVGVVGVNSLNHQTTVSGDIEVSLKEVNLTTPILFRYGPGVFQSSPGRCWGFVKESSLVYTHEKHELGDAHSDYKNRH